MLLSSSVDRSVANSKAYVSNYVASRERPVLFAAIQDGQHDGPLIAFSRLTASPREDAPRGPAPAVTQALARGELSYAKVRALTRVATPETEARLLAVGRAGTAIHVALLRQALAAAREELYERGRRARARRTAHVLSAEWASGSGGAPVPCRA